MGADGSHQVPTDIIPQIERICATEPRFCLQTPVLLRLREKMSFSGDDFKITDGRTGALFFQCEGCAFSLREKKVLRDNLGNPVLNMKEQMLSFNDKFRVFAGQDSSREICRFTTQLTFVTAKLYSEFIDVISHRARLVVLKGDWRNKRCVLYLGEPKQGGVPIGRIDRPTTGRTLLFGVDDYFIEIAAGVDIALMVIMCIALDEHTRDK